VEYRNDWDHKEMVRNVTVPTLTAFLPESSAATGAAVVVCPGGGFRFLSWESEGTQVARWLQARGVAAFVLRYRLTETPASEEAFRKNLAAFFGRLASRSGRGADEPAKSDASKDQAKPGTASRPAVPESMREIASLASADGRQAIKVVRQHAAEWGIKPDCVGIMGFSAGGMVTMGVVMEHDAASRPDFAAPIYGGGTGGAKVPDDAPPLFILCASDDQLAAGSARLYSEWKAAGRPVELHIYEKGGHGFGMTPKGLPVDHWVERFGDWLGQRGLIKGGGSIGTSNTSDLTPSRPELEAAQEIPLYSGAAPGSESWDWKERSATTPNGLPIVTDVVRPVLLYYPAGKDKAVGTAMIVAPGGGFRALMMSYEGVDIARRLNAMGVDAFILKYRLIHGSGPGGPPRQDAIRLAGDDGRLAVRLVREKAGELGYRPARVGMIGFSAGGMVTAEALFGPAESRPNFAAIIYGAREVKDVPKPAPPLFLAVAADDAMAVGRTIDLFKAYRQAKGPAELHVFQMGAHGFVNKGGGADHFMDRLAEWLSVNKLLSRDRGQKGEIQSNEARGAR
jgi:acetyl esterase/lipase